MANIALDSTLKGRNKQEKLKLYIHKNNLLYQETIIVGDTIEEIEIGKKLGIPTVAVTGGFCTSKRLKSAKPDYLVTSLKEIPEIIKNL